MKSFFVSLMLLPMMLTSYNNHRKIIKNRKLTLVQYY